MPPFALSAARWKASGNHDSHQQTLVSGRDRGRLPPRPAFGQSGASNVDVAIIGAGAAGIAAARRIAAAGKRAVILEAADRVGGRCLTDTQPVRHAVRSRRALDPHAGHQSGREARARAPGSMSIRRRRGQQLRIGRRNAREGELEDFLAALVRCNRAIEDAARGKVDMSCAQALPKDLGDLQAVGGIFSRAVRLRQGFARDLGDGFREIRRARHRRVLPAGFRRAAGEARRRPAGGIVGAGDANRHIGRSGGVEIETAKGRISARAVIVTASTNVLTSGKIKFTPDLPKRQLDACDKLSLGSYDRIALELPGNPLGLQRDDLMFEKADSKRTAALLANVGGSTSAFVDVGGKFGRELAAQGQGAMTAFAIEWLTGLFGADIGKAVGKSHATQWNDSPYALGAFSAAAVGGQPSRRILMEPLRERVFFAGEAVHETLWGTVGGAWESGERAAAAVPRCGCSASAPKPARSAAPSGQAAAASAAMTQKPKALIAWSSGKDSAWALHEVRRARRLRHRRRAHDGDGHIRAREHAWRARGDCCARSSRRPACRRSSCAFRFPARTTSTSARWPAAWRRRKRTASRM